MSRKVGIIVSLVLALVVTFFIVNAAGKDYEEATEKVEAVKTTDDIPIGEVIDENNTKQVEVLEKAAENMAVPEKVIGKTASVSMVKGQYVYEGSTGTGGELRSGYVEVFVPVDLSSSAYALAGHKVNVHILQDKRASDNKNGEYSTLKNIRVLHCLDGEGNNVGRAGSITDKVNIKNSLPSAMGLEVPEEEAQRVVKAASEDRVYLTRCSKKNSKKDILSKTKGGDTNNGMPGGSGKGNSAGDSKGTEES